MAKQTSEGLNASIEDYLLALATSVQQAQLQLSRMRIASQAGQPAVTYHLPRLDFELRLSFEVAHGQDKQLELRMRPVNPHAAGPRHAVAEAASIIKGSFVAVPSDGGRPPLILRSQLQRVSLAHHLWQVTVTVETAAGEPEAGVEVQFNVDRDLSDKLDKAETEVSRNWDKLVGTNVRNGKVLTDAEGRAVTYFGMDKDEPVGAHAVLVIDASGESETIVFRAEKIQEFRPW